MTVCPCSLEDRLMCDPRAPGAGGRHGIIVRYLRV